MPTGSVRTWRPRRRRSRKSCSTTRTDWDFLLCRAEANGQVVLVQDDKVTSSEAGDVRLGRVADGLRLDRAGAGCRDRLPLAEQRHEGKLLECAPTKPWSMPTPTSLPCRTAGNLAASDLAKVLGDGTERDQTRRRISTNPNCKAGPMRDCCACVSPRSEAERKCQGFAGVLPGQIVEITGIGDRFAGQLYVSGVRHTVSSGNWETDVQFGLEPRTVYRDLQFASAACGGLAAGCQRTADGDRDGAGKRSRLRRSHQVSGSRSISANEEGIWARLATLDAGEDRGTFFRPEIDDEVVVGFLNEDPRYPVILGMCHSSAKPAPEPAKDENHLKGYVSREKLKLTFDDDKKVIAFETPGGNKMALTDDAKGSCCKTRTATRSRLTTAA